MLPLKFGLGRGVTKFWTPVGLQLPTAALEGKPEFEPPTSVSPPLSLGLRPRLLRLRFPDASLERSFQEQYFRDNIGYVRAAHVLAIGAWAFFGLFMAPERGHGWYLAIFAVAIVVTAVSLGLSFSRRYARWWQRPIVALVVVSAVAGRTALVKVDPATATVTSLTDGDEEVQGATSARDGRLALVVSTPTRVGDVFSTTAAHPPTTTAATPPRSRAATPDS